MTNLDYNILLALVMKSRSISMNWTSKQMSSTIEAVIVTLFICHCFVITGFVDTQIKTVRGSQCWLLDLCSFGSYFLIISWGKIISTLLSSWLLMLVMSMLCIHLFYKSNIISSSIAENQNYQYPVLLEDSPF